MEASPKHPHIDRLDGPAGSRLLSCQPDAVLCRMAARGSDRAYEALYSRHHQSVYAFVFHLLGGRHCAADAEDIAQDAFARGYAAIRQKRDGSFRHWIFTIARNRAIDHVRARAPRVVPLHDETVEQDPAAAVGCASEAAEDRADFAWMLEAVTELPERQREALVLRELGGLSHAEIAEQLDTTVQATKQLIKRARAGVGEAAREKGFRSRHIGRELKLAAPLAPLAATAGFGAAGAGAAGFGSGALIGKTAAAMLCVAALGGTTVAVERSLAPVGAGSELGPVRASAAAAVPDPAPRPQGGDAAGTTAKSVGDDASTGRTRDSKRGSDGDSRRDGAVVAPSTAPSASGSAAAGGGVAEGRSGAAAPANGLGTGEAVGSKEASANGGAAAPR